MTEIGNFGKKIRGILEILTTYLFFTFTIVFLVVEDGVLHIDTTAN